ncbi:serine/arginine repetitive matrix protein 1-like [Mustela erminea]|uniref:serine/arginine repetitive matrix protein 1-like n=1 Tax=Mustela erminea TaxID=36723 RepID=UPI001387680A|nr:serine/arginine repetitive matrix protein 1-like [Mustela erminea]
MYLISVYLGNLCVMKSQEHNKQRRIQNLYAEEAIKFTLSNPPCRREYSPPKARRENESSGPHRRSGSGSGSGSSETPAQTAERHTGNSAAETKRQGAAGAGREQRRGSAGPRGRQRCGGQEGSAADTEELRRRLRAVGGSGRVSRARGCTRPRLTPQPRQRSHARHQKRRTVSTSAPRTHHWELRNGGGRGGEAGGRARRSQSPPPASFEPAPKTAEGVGRRGRVGRGRRRSPPRASGACARPQPIGTQREDAGAGALGRRALDQGRATPSSPQSKQNKGGSARAGGPRRRRQREGQGASGVGAPGERPRPLAFGVQRVRAHSPPACSVLRYLCAPPFLAPAFGTASQRRSRCRSSSPPPLSSRPCRRALPPRPPARGPARARTPVSAPPPRATATAPPARGSRGNARDLPPRPGARERERALGGGRTPGMRRYVRPRFSRALPGGAR